MTSTPRSGRNKRPKRGKPARSRQSPRRTESDSLWIYGLHPVEAALANPRRARRRLLATRNALARLTEAGVTPDLTPEESTPRDLDRLLGSDAVHQGIALEVEPLATLTLNELAKARLVVVLDQVTDPHNVGAILRSALAFGADAVVSTFRHAPAETGVLAKSASGALDRIPLITVTNLARALGEIGRMGFNRIGLDSEAPIPIEKAVGGERIALVLGAEGKGLRALTRETCDAMARLALPGPLASLNVSNAAVLALYLARTSLDGD